jgi:hypothetical protein
VVEAVLHRIDVDTLDPKPAAELAVNDIGRLVLRTASPLFFDAYRENPSTGSFVLVDSGTNATVGAGMIQQAAGQSGEERAEGKMIAFHGAPREAYRLAASLRRFGYPVLVVSPDQVESIRLAISQGFDVLINGQYSGAHIVAGEDVLERALSYLEGETNE